MIKDANHWESASVAYKHVREGQKGKQPLIVVFGYGSYGDALQITGFLGHLRQRFPSARVALVHPNRAVPALLDGTKLVDTFCSLSPPVATTLMQMLCNEEGADLLCNCRYVIEYILPSTSNLADIEKQFIEDAQAKQKCWLPLVQRFPLDNDILWVTAAKAGLNMYSLMAETSGFSGGDFESLHIELCESDFSLRSQLPERYIAVANSAEALSITRSDWTKTLPNEKMARIARKLKRLGVPTVLLGASIDDAPVNGVDFDWRGRSSLRETAAILKDSALFIAPEGGITNLARAVGKRGVVFFGSTPVDFFGFRDNANILPKLCGNCWWTTQSYLYHCPRLQLNPDCVQSISEEEILHATRRMLS